MWPASSGAFSLLLLVFGRRVEFASHEGEFKALPTMNGLPMDYSERSTMSHTLCPKKT
jgi:hypothetical protein